MKKALMKLLLHLVLYAALFFVVPPVLGLFFNSEEMKGVILLLLFYVNPTFCLVLGTLFGCDHGFKPYYPFIPPLFFMLSVWVIYNSSALIYAVLYLAVALFGLSAGSVYHCISRRNQSKRDKENAVPNTSE